MQNEHYDIEVEFKIAVMESTQNDVDVNILLAIFKEYGKLKYNTAVKETTTEFERKRG